MRIALFADIHGNLVSMEAVLDDIRKSDVDQIVFLGDTATFGPYPHDVIRRLRQLDYPCVLGNHDQFLIDPESMPSLNWVPSWYREQVTKRDIEYLKTFKPSIEIQLDADNTLLCYHGSPRSNTENIFPLTPPEELDEMIGYRKTTVLAGAHTHLQMLRQEKGMTIVNSGSVGQPFEEVPYPPKPGPRRFLPWAEYAIINWTNGRLNVELRHVPVNVKLIKHAIRKSRMPNADYWESAWMLPEEQGHILMRNGEQQNNTEAPMHAAFAKGADYVLKSITFGDY
jgi:putative phosphoesterase